MILSQAGKPDMTLKKTALLLPTVAALALTACAEKAENISAAYVSPQQYQSFNCRQVEQEARRVTARAAQTAGVQDKNASNDAAITAVSLILFWPAAFFINGNKENAAELSRLRGELEALEQASIQKRCGIEFR
jgi:ABC-type sugar transport system substrate-binding protein